MARRDSSVNGQFGFLEFEHALVLLDQRVLRLGQNAHQIVLGKLGQASDDRDAADEFGDHAELVQILGQNLRQQRGIGVLFGLGHHRH